MNDLMFILVPFLLGIGLFGWVFGYERFASWLFDLETLERYNRALGEGEVNFDYKRRTLLQVEGTPVSFDPGSGTRKESCQTAIILRHYYSQRFYRSVSYARGAIAFAGVQCLVLASIGIFDPLGTADTRGPLLVRGLVILLSLILCLWVVRKEKQDFYELFRPVATLAGS